MRKFYTLVDLEYFVWLTLRRSLACCAILVIFIFVEVVLPVVMMSMSISPVTGSVAACCVATFMRLMAYSTSSTET